MLTVPRKGLSMDWVAQESQEGFAKSVDDKRIGARVDSSDGMHGSHLLREISSNHPERTGVRGKEVVGDGTG